MRTREEITEANETDNAVVIELLLDIRDLLAPKKREAKTTEITPEVQKILEAYRAKIKNSATLTEMSIKKIHARLKNYPVGVIIQAIDRFSQNNWWMEHKGHESMKWFFRDDDQIEKFKELKPDKNKESQWI